MSTNIDLAETQGQLEWLKQKLFLNSIAVNARRRLVKRGQVYHCNLGMGVGSEMQKERPCVIVQTDIANVHSPNTLIVPITHGAVTISTMIPIADKFDSSGNKVLDGSANVSNVSCISKARLGDYICDLSSAEMKSIDEAIAKSFDIIHYYSDILNKYNNNVAYTNTVKAARNNAEDKLKIIQEMLDGDEQPDVTIKKLKEFFEKC